MSHHTSIQNSITTTPSPNTPDGPFVILTTTTITTTTTTENHNGINPGVIHTDQTSVTQLNTASRPPSSSTLIYTHTDNWSDPKLDCPEPYLGGKGDAELECSGSEGTTNEKAGEEEQLMYGNLRYDCREKQDKWKPIMWWQALRRYKELKREIKEQENEVQLWRARYDGGFI
ncbi:hypothetical protein BJ508DRAFT_412514 [Ascobolus immersus RN42]|uniref:Uncharacterized protein n=1 Tax=Ascobolus immersus RN42 TaxID=1160509 RepID=A0A3N4IGL0_ASCIM|nr:hypothetical protein BJ508DRAFT_412514 [Ascobolus immersus RN42]